MCVCVYAYIYTHIHITIIYTYIWTYISIIIIEEVMNLRRKWREGGVGEQRRKGKNDMCIHVWKFSKTYLKV